MKSGKLPDTTGHFALKWLPWILAFAALLFYLANVNPWLSLLTDWTSTPLFIGEPIATARVAGWVNLPERFAPAYYILTYPFRWMPERLIPYGLNLFSVACAVLTLWQLARTVALLPHDRTRAQRDREEHEHSLLTIRLAWIPPLFAALILGFQLSFMEHATNASVEMLDMLMFAYIVRCILEFRVAHRDSLLQRAAFVFTLGIANNFWMIAWSPVFLVSLIWCKRLEFFKARFLTRIFLWGLAGLSLYLLLPLVNSMQPDQPFTFWQLLKFNLGTQWEVLSYSWRFLRLTFLLMGLYSLIPVILYSIRWAASFGDPSQIGVTITTTIFHLSHLIVLLACCWVSLDPAFSPRQLGANHDFVLFRCFSFLTAYYFVALNVGYFSGYFLLVFRALGTRLRPPTSGAILLERAAVAGVVLLALLIPAAQAYRNLPQISLTNGPIYRQLAEAVTRNLPQKGLLITDDGNQLSMVNAALAQSGRSQDYVPLFSRLLVNPDYHGFLAQKYPGRWQSITNADPTQPIEPVILVQMIQAASKTNQIAYLHPSFGYYFEYFNAVPHGISYHLTPRPDGVMLTPPVSDEIIKINETFWDDLTKTALPLLLKQVEPVDPAQSLPLPERIFNVVKLPKLKNTYVVSAAEHYSRSLVWWGMQLQKAGQFEKATRHFDLALRLNPDNVAADINKKYNQHRLEGKTGPIISKFSIEEHFGKSRQWDQVMSFNGPFDEPTLTYMQGMVFFGGNNLRQAADCFDRVQALSPDDIASCLMLAKLHIDIGLPDIGLKYVEEVRTRAARQPEATSSLADLFTLEASAWFAKQQPQTAIAIIEAKVNAAPTNATVLAAARNSYIQHKDYTNAIRILDRELSIVPHHLGLLFLRGNNLLQADRMDEAIADYNRVLAVETNALPALLNRAIAKLKAERFDEAKQDYEAVQRQDVTVYQVDFGLGEIALRKGDTNSAIRNFEAYLTHASTNTIEWQIISNRISELRTSQSAKPKSP